MLTDAMLEELRYKGEGTDLDYKSERYPFARASDDEKSEMLKDILAMANTHRSGTAYILIGFKESSPYPAEVVGLSQEGAVDDSRLQEFVNGKLETKLTFRYEERIFEDKHIAVISIPKQQQRPFYLKKSYGKLSQETVYVRRGSSTSIASPREIAMMGAANAVRGEAQVQLLFLTPENQALPDSFDRAFLNFPKNLPDYGPNRSDFLYAHTRVNEDYWRDGARFYSCWRRMIQVRLSLENQSEFPLRDVHVEIVCRCPESESVSLLRADHMPGEPDSSEFARLQSLAAVIEHANQKVGIDERGREPVAHVIIGSMRPGQTVRAEEDLAIMPTSPGHYALQVRILANELPMPLLIEHSFEVTGEVSTLTSSDLVGLMTSVNESDAGD
ncbi:putative DNA-binding domain protein [compost metagenome]